MPGQHQICVCPIGLVSESAVLIVHLLESSLSRIQFKHGSRIQIQIFNRTDRLEKLFEPYTKMTDKQAPAKKSAKGKTKGARKQ